MTQFPSKVEITRRTDGSVRHIDGTLLDSELLQDAKYLFLKENQDYAAMAQRFVVHYADELRLSDPVNELSLTKTQGDMMGYHIVRFGQEIGGQPVINAELSVHFNSDDRIYLVQGDYASTPVDIALTPALSAADALNAVQHHEPKATATVKPSSAIWRAPTGSLHLVYQVQLRRSLAEQFLLFVDAATGDVLLQTATVYH